MKKFLTYTLVALLAGLGVRIIFGAPILLTFLFLEVIYGLYFITQQLSRGWKIVVIAVVTIFILIQGLVWLKGNIEQNFPLIGVFSKPYIKLGYDVNTAANLTPSMIKAKQLLLQKQIDYEDRLAYRVDKQFKDGNPYNAIKLIEAGEKQGRKVRETIIMEDGLPLKEKTVVKSCEITPQTSYGWKVDGCGNLVADLKPGEEITKVFRMSEGYSTPFLVLPPEGYRLRFDHLQTIIVEEKGRSKKIVHPDDYYNMGVTQGQRRELKFTALKGGAEVITTLRRRGN